MEFREEMTAQNTKMHSNSYKKKQDILLGRMSPAANIDMGFKA